MHVREKYLRSAVGVILCAFFMYLFVSKPALPIYLETGKLPAIKVPETTAPTIEASPPPETTQPPPPALPVFSPEDASLVSVNSNFSYQADLDAFLQAPLQWDLHTDAPSVLILHTHATESYLKTESYTETSAYRTLNEQYNMVSIGDRIAQSLENQGISVLHDRTLHDYPSYNDAYYLARDTIAAYLKKYPSIRLVLDLHRDSITDANGKQLGETVSTELGNAVRVMLVVGTDAGGSYHPDWEENMALAVKLHARLEQRYPGICRPISLRTQRYNQDLFPATLLIEVGAAGNTREEALLSAQLLSQCISDLSRGSATANSTR